MSIIHELTERAHRQSAGKGFHDYQPADQRTATALNAEVVALIHSEASEALEAMRTGKPVDKNWYPHHAEGCDESLNFEGPSPEDCTCIPKPEGVPSELADVVIRVMDFCGARGIDLEEVIIEKLDYNATRGHKHGGKAF